MCEIRPTLNSYVDNIHVFLQQFFYPDNDEFRLGIQKSRKTIQDAVADTSIFEGEAMDTMFRMMRRVTEMRSVPKVGGKVFFPPYSSIPLEHSANVILRFQHNLQFYSVH